MFRQIFLFLSLCTCLFSQQTKPSEVELSWEENDQFLFLNIDLENGLEFNKTYDVFRLKNGGLGLKFAARH